MMKFGLRGPLRRWAPVMKIVLGTALTVGVTDIAWAGHCSYCSPPLPNEVHLLATSIPADGVLALYLSDREGHDVQFALSFLELTVTDEIGVSIPGALEVHEGFAVAAWRPDVPWTPGSTVRLTWSIDLDRIYAEVYGESPGGCLEVGGEHEVEILADPLAPARPRVSFRSFTEVEPARSLDTFVCCDASYPRLDSRLPAWRLPLRRQPPVAGAGPLRRASGHRKGPSRRERRAGGSGSDPAREPHGPLRRLAGRSRVSERHGDLATGHNAVLRDARGSRAGER